MTRLETIFAFVQRKKGSGKHALTSDGERLYSYSTCIAEWLYDAGRWYCIINPTKYSRTTTSHLSLLSNKLFQDGYHTFTLHNNKVPLGAYSLIKLFEKEREQWS